MSLEAAEKADTSPNLRTMLERVEKTERKLAKTDERLERVIENVAPLHTDLRRYLEGQGALNTRVENVLGAVRAVLPYLAALVTAAVLGASALLILAWKAYHPSSAP